jgi:ubiquinone/menaquinone biosynthesis C-methylase UbiE
MNERTFSVTDAHRLDDPERLLWLPPKEVIASLELKYGQSVADIGAGTGYFTLGIAKEVGSEGRVYAVDFQTGMLDLLGKKLLEPNAPSNVTLVHGTAERTMVPPASVDLAFLANIWHELDDYGKVLQETAHILRPAGRIAILDWRADVAPPPGPPRDHRKSAEDVIRTLTADGLAVERSGHVGKFGYLIIARYLHKK